MIPLTYAVIEDEPPARARLKRLVAELDPGVVGRLVSCEPGAEWCQVQVGSYHGWLRRAEFWGSFPGEAVQ